jgi:hypothetical protein
MGSVLLFKKINFVEKIMFIPDSHHIIHIFIISIETKTVLQDTTASSSPPQMKILSAARYSSATVITSSFVENLFPVKIFNLGKKKKFQRHNTSQQSWPKSTTATVMKIFFPFFANALSNCIRRFA